MDKEGLGRMPQILTRRVFCYRAVSECVCLFMLISSRSLQRKSFLLLSFWMFDCTSVLLSLFCRILTLKQDCASLLCLCPAAGPRACLLSQARHDWRLTVVFWFIKRVCLELGHVRSPRRAGRVFLSDGTIRKQRSRQLTPAGCF